MSTEGKNDDGASSCNPFFILESIPKFTGDDVTYSAAKWTQDLDDNAEIFGWGQQHKLIIARRRLAGTAELWLKTEKPFRTYEELKVALLKEFPETINSKQMHELMSKRRKRSDETLYQYMLVMKELGKRARFPDYVSIQYIIDGIPDYESNKLLLYGVTTYAALKEKLVLYETFKQKTKREAPKQPQTPRDEAKTLSHLRCYKCGDKGHLSSSCDKGIKCFRCNGFGHIGTECKKTDASTEKKIHQNTSDKTRRSMFVQHQNQSSGGATNANEVNEGERSEVSDILNEQVSECKIETSSLRQ